MDAETKKDSSSVDRKVDCSSSQSVQMAGDDDADDAITSGAAAGTSTSVVNEPTASSNVTKPTSSNDDKKKVAAGAVVDDRFRALAESRLSKWAARIVLEPDRKRGFVEPPKIIPLNDEFLSAFGQRSKAFDDARGVEIEIDRQPIDDVLDENDRLPDDDGASSNRQQEEQQKKKKLKKDTMRKVKICNLKYTTTEETLQERLENYGVVERLHLIEDKNNPALNVGIAYVTYEDATMANECSDKLKELEGRPIRTLVVRDTSSDNASGSTTPGGGKKAVKRYWVQDISTKCFRCGKIGHVADQCTNDATVKPCPLCGRTDDGGHEMRDCPFRATCFNCGVPGHVSRSCPQPRGLPPRRICTVCLRSGHSKTQCTARVDQARRWNAATEKDAICMMCGQSHYLCKELKWFFGLNGVTCSNCGRVGHIGAGCDRPRLDVCCLRHNDDLVALEIERAAAYSTAEDLIEQQQRQQQQQQQQQQQHQQRRRWRWDGGNSNNQKNDDEQSRGRSRDPASSGQNNNSQNGANDKRRRVQSMPPQNRTGGGNNRNLSGGSKGGGSNKRGGGDSNRSSSNGNKNKRGRWR